MGVAAEIANPDVVAPDDQDVRLLALRHGLAPHATDEPGHRCEQARALSGIIRVAAQIRTTGSKRSLLVTGAFRRLRAALRCPFAGSEEFSWSLGLSSDAKRWAQSAIS